MLDISELTKKTDPKTKKKMESIRRELQRRSMDRLIVKNPLKEDRAVIWDGFKHVVKAGDERQLPRYLAEKFIKETVNHLINLEIEEVVQKENDRRGKSGQKDMDPQERELFETRQKLKTSNVDLREKYTREIYAGISQEYGKEELLDRKEDVRPDRRPSDAVLLEKLDQERGEEPPERKEKPKEKLEKSIKKKK